MAPHSSSGSDDGVPINSTAVAVDKDKNSQHAVRWAIDNLVITNPFVVLIHVRNKNHEGEPESDHDINRLFIPFRGYCARKAIQSKEVILEETDICKAILDYVNDNLVNKLVIGAHTRHGLSRKFKHDISTSLIKAAPDFCSVYVISKGKILTTRTAQRTILNTATPPKAPYGPQIPSDLHEDDGHCIYNRGHYAKGGPKHAVPDRMSLDINPRPRVPMRARDRQRSSPANLSFDVDSFIRARQSSPSQESSPTDSEFLNKLSLGSMERSDQDLDFSTKSIPQSPRDIEAEMRSDMAHPSSSGSDNGVPINSTAVAVDKDRNSQHAVRWAIDNLVITNPFIVLIHVRNKNHGEPESDHDINKLFIPFRGYCARKAIQSKEIILEENDICKALLDYVSNNLVNKLVIGAPTRNGLSSYLHYRKFKHDIPTSLIKAAPDFCSVYVISKGKILTTKTAQRTISNTAIPPKAPYGVPPQIPSDQLEDNVGTRAHYAKGGPKHAVPDRMSLDINPRPRVPMSARDRQRSSPANLSFDIESFIRAAQSSSSQDSSPIDSEFLNKLSLGSMESPDKDLDFSTKPLPQSPRDIEVEMRRLKLELKQIMDLYSTACKEAIAAKKKADELHQWKMEEARKFEEARQSGEAALAMAEKEKAKSKAAIEAAQAAQRLAEMEAHRRRQAELIAKKESYEKDRAMNALANNDVRYRKYTIEEIEQATENFEATNKIGEGGYGPVYKGKLDHTPVAIKVLRPDAAQGMKQFQQEVEVLCCMRHPNMVLLLGACPEYGCLVYEHMHNGSLEDRLFRRGDTPPLSWRIRFKIASEIATAMLFMHQAKPEPLVHRDLKPANILIDRNYVSKISDVGLARLVPPSVADSVTQYHMTSAAGTFCYIDPEYQQSGRLTTKSDIYSFGIMLLQIITARPPMGIAHHVGRAIEKGTLADVLDPAVKDWPVDEALAFAQLALKCVELRKNDRPDLGTVIVPELNRLKDLGRSSGSGYNGYSHSSYGSSQGYNSTTGNIRSPRPRISSETQESSSNTIASSDT